MGIQKFLQKAKKFEVGAYRKLQALSRHNVAFSGTPQKHPYDEDKMILVADPLSSQMFYYEFQSLMSGVLKSSASLSPRRENPLPWSDSG